MRFFLGRFEICKKSITFLFLILVEKSPNTSYRAMQYLQNELLTSILCQIEPDVEAFEICVLSQKTSLFHTPISRNPLDLDQIDLAYVSF